MNWSVAAIGFVASVLSTATAQAQAPRVEPAKGYVFHDERMVDRFIVQRWVLEDSPGVSPAGNCACYLVVYVGPRQVLALERASGITDVAPLVDVTGDGWPELVVTTDSGGAHCCTSVAIYSTDAVPPRSLLSISTGHCTVDLIDLDGDGVPEVRTCDDAFAYEFCPFAFSPFPPAVFAYDRAHGEFVLATRRFARFLPVPTTAEAQEIADAHRNNQEVVRCAALRPALTLIYTGQESDGLRLFRQLYRQPDAAAVEEKAMSLARKSRLWVAR